MPTVHLPQDEPFFREWLLLRGRATRSLTRANLLAEALDILDPKTKILTVVGSKGKGTAAAFASASLAAAGLSVGTISSPPFRSNCERIRVNGKAIGLTEYSQLSQDLDDALRTLGAPASGYIAPTGAYTIAGASYLVNKAQVDVLVLEEGLGGASDEVSLFSPDTVALTPVFEEHKELLGGSLCSVARDLLGVITSETRHLVSSPQAAAVQNEMLENIPRGTHIEWITGATNSYAQGISGLGDINAQVGVTAASALIGRTVGPAQVVNLPGRLSVHAGPAGSRWIVDAAIDPVGVSASRAWHQELFGRPDMVIACFPDDKMVEQCFSALGGLKVLATRAGLSHLQFRRTSPFSPVPLARAFKLGSLEQQVFCVGTISFISQVLDFLQADTSDWW